MSEPVTNTTEAQRNIMVRVGGKSFRCDCGCNVFHAGKQPLTYICNACGTGYVGEPTNA
jgi:hypothetical protein